MIREGTRRVEPLRALRPLMTLKGPGQRRARWARYSAPLRGGWAPTRGAPTWRVGTHAGCPYVAGGWFAMIACMIAYAVGRSAPCISKLMLLGLLT
jgi:hypothetical protein